jgi:hypothetical protein
MHIETLNINFAPTVPAAEAMAATAHALHGLVRASATAMNAGETLSTALNDGPPAPGELWPGQGGHYVCTLPAQFGLPARHLILATVETEDLTWGGYGEDFAGTNETDGRANTAALLADSTTHPAAQWAAKHTHDGHTDFYLPSRIELLMCYLYTPQAFKTSGWYWSSSQCSRYYAWCQDFEYGYSSALSKDSEFRARPVRSIQL